MGYVHWWQIFFLMGKITLLHVGLLIFGLLLNVNSIAGINEPGSESISINMVNDLEKTIK